MCSDECAMVAIINSLGVNLVDSDQSGLGADKLKVTQLD